MDNSDVFLVEKKLLVKISETIIFIQTMFLTFFTRLKGFSFANGIFRSLYFIHPKQKIAQSRDGSDKTRRFDFVKLFFNVVIKS